MFTNRQRVHGDIPVIGPCIGRCNRDPGVVSSVARHIQHLTPAGWCFGQQACAEDQRLAQGGRQLHLGPSCLPHRPDCAVQRLGSVEDHPRLDHLLVARPAPEIDRQRHFTLRAEDRGLHLGVRKGRRKAVGLDHEVHRVDRA